jgi:hypothetical protein
MPAVTSVTNFSDGNVLTATALNAVNCGIHVYSNAAARDAAYGGSGERTLVEGEYAYLLDTDQTLVYSGSSWVTVGVTPGLIPITATSLAVGGGTATSAGNGQVTATSVTTSLSLNGVFSAAYTNYRIMYNFITASGSNVSWRLRVGGSDNTTANYDTMLANFQNTAVQSVLISAATFGYLYAGGGGLQHTGAIDIYRPFETSTTSTFTLGAEQASLTAVNRPFYYQSLQAQSLSFDGFTFLTTAAATGTVSVYGYNI